MRPSFTTDLRPHAFSRRIAIHTLAATLLLIGVTMISLIAFSVCLIASEVAAGHGSNVSGSVTEAKPIGQFRRDTKTFIGRSKNNDEPQARNEAIVDLCLLHMQIVNDPRFRNNQQLKGFRAICADRLKKCRRQIELEMLREQRQTGKPKPRVDADSNSTTSMATTSKGGRYYGRDSSDSESEFESHQQMLVEDMQTITTLTGGPIRVWNHIGGQHGGPACDYGPDLVRLIETTIHPDSWQSGGGNGVIYYYQPLRILVVTASSQVHDEMTDLLRTLRSNSR